jgi:uncharacterized protein
MRALLDVNVLIALLDAGHSMHRRATQWFSAEAAKGWASCPITQNGCVRIMSHQGYPNSLPVNEIVLRLREACLTDVHQFWLDDLSMLDPTIADSTRLHGPRQITDIYLLALAARHGGRLVTFDESIFIDAVRGATKKHLLTL